MKLLVLSNGHGEDRVAVRIIEQLQIITNLELAALPIVGQGYAYSKSKIAIAGRVQQMPSGGFIYKGGNPLWQDLRGGLVRLTLEQIEVVRRWGREGGVILAVGDIVPLLYAWSSKANYAFVGTARSDYYLRNEEGWLSQTSWIERKIGSVYMPWERWLMSRNACKGVFPRDSLTAEILRRRSIRAYDLGNPMMDGISASVEPSSPDTLNILLLPGSRTPEALRNWKLILDGVSQTIKTCQSRQLNFKLNFISAIAPALDLQPFVRQAQDKQWQAIKQESPTAILVKNNISLTLSQNSYARFLQQADIAIAMAGTATEEFVGLGKPAIIMPGSGPQFTYAFAEAQSRLLGCSIAMVENPNKIPPAILQIINNPQQLEQIANNGKRRMGEAGAALRIARCLKKTLLAK